MFLDESGVTTEMTRRYGWALRGKRVREATPAEHWSTLTLLGALTSQGLLASMTVESPTDGDVFLAYLEEVLCPCLRPGQIVIADNLSAHKVDGVWERIEAAGAQLWYLPPYSPDLNPIELWFAKLKALLRTARRRTVEELWETVGACLSLFSAIECRNYFRHCGYAATTQS